jgi:hypothetical protein
VTPDMPALVDTANEWLAPGPASLSVGIRSPDAGTHAPDTGILTIRTSTATLTVQLPREQVLAWGRMITELGDSMRGGSVLLVATPGTLLRPGQ